VKRSKKPESKARRPRNKKTSGKARARASTAADGEFAAGPFGASLDRFFDLQRKVLRAGSAAARSAVDNPASKRVKDGVTDSLQGGLRKLEQVFDERVASALERLGMPSPKELREMRAAIDALTKSRSSK
jgi:Poly(hydroxyalcanoate) granule associated protein (phasin)